MRKEKWRMTRIFIGILIIVLLVSSIIFDIIFYLTKWYPNIIIRIIVIYLFFEIILRFTWFGKEIEIFIKNKFKKTKKKK